MYSCVYICIYINICVYTHTHTHTHTHTDGLLWRISSQESACNAGAAAEEGLTPGVGRAPGGGHDSQLLCSGVENLMERRARQATVHRVTKGQTRLK